MPDEVQGVGSDGQSEICVLAENAQFVFTVANPRDRRVIALRGAFGMAKFSCSETEV